MTASASRCSSWRSAASARQQLGSRQVATALREPLRVGIVLVGQLGVHELVAERQHGGAGGESGRDDEIVVPVLDAPRLRKVARKATLRTSKLTRRWSATMFAMTALLALLLHRLRRGEEG